MFTIPSIIKSKDPWHHSEVLKLDLSFGRLILIGVLVLASVSVACSVPQESTATPVRITPASLPTPSASLTPTPPPSLVTTPTRVAISTLAPLVIPTPPSNGMVLALSPESNQTGWIGSRQNDFIIGDDNLPVGMLNGESFVSVLQFNVMSLAPGTKILFAALELTGRNTDNLKTQGEWNLDLLDVAAPTWSNVTYDTINRAPVLGTVRQRFASTDLAAGLRKRFIFSSQQLALLQKQIDVGGIFFRLGGPTQGDNNLFTWDAKPGPNEPTLYLVAIPAPFAVVTTTPTPPNVFAAATLVVQQTTLARAIGTPTPLPRAFVTTTPQPNVAPVLITSIPTPVDVVERTATSVYATAVAFTTGTFTPIPYYWVTATPRPLLIPREQLTAVPTPTMTPARVDLLELAKKPLPSMLYNKIMFQEGPHDDPKVWVMDPDGSNVQLLTDQQYFEIAKIRDTISPDGSKWVYQWPDGYGNLQLWLRDLKYPDALPVEITFGGSGNGIVYGQAWSPDGKKIAYTSATIARQEIWVFTFPNTTKRLTFSTGWYWNQFPSWSPDGKQIVFSSDFGHDAKYSEIWVMDEDGKNWKKLGNGVWDTYNPVWVKWRQ